MPSSKALISFTVFCFVGTAAITLPAFLAEDASGFMPLPSDLRQDFSRPLVQAWDFMAGNGFGQCQPESHEFVVALGLRRASALSDPELANYLPTTEIGFESRLAPFATFDADDEDALIGLTLDALPQANCAEQRILFGLTRRSEVKTTEADPEPDTLSATHSDDPNREWQRHTIRNGELLSTLWQREWGLAIASLYVLLEDSRSAQLLNRLFPGQEVEWLTDAEGRLLHLRIWQDRAGGYEWLRADDAHAFNRADFNADRTVVRVALTGKIHRNLEVSLMDLGPIGPRLAARIADEINTQARVSEHLRDGDKLAILLEQEFLVGETTPYSQKLLAFKYQGAKLQVAALRHDDGYFYTPDGHSLLPPFDRKPFVGEFRLSSGFTERRRHPVTGRVTAHPGVDWVMPIGTAIHAPADGVVTLVDNGHATAGRYIEIDHADGYQTRYMHLSRIQVTKGQTVTRGQTIGLSGNSGRVTAPHLHYELLINGRAVDPMLAELPGTQALTGRDLARFQSQTLPLFAELRQDSLGERFLAMLPFFGR